MKEVGLLEPKRRRRIEGGFSFIPHRFLREGFLMALEPYAILLYLFFVLAGNGDGLSFYNPRTICRLLKMSPLAYQEAFDELVESDLICSKDHVVQVLHLPPKPLMRKEMDHGKENPSGDLATS